MYAPIRRYDRFYPDVEVWGLSLSPAFPYRNSHQRAAFGCSFLDSGLSAPNPVIPQRSSGLLFPSQYPVSEVVSHDFSFHPSPNHRYSTRYCAPSPFLQSRDPSPPRTIVRERIAPEKIRKSIEKIPPLYSPLFEFPEYVQIWEHFNEPTKSRFFATQVQLSPRVDSVVLKLPSDKDRDALLLQTLETGVSGWLKLQQFEMDHGEFHLGHAVLSTAIRLFPRSELLLQKRLKNEERLNHVRHVSDTMRLLREVNTSRAVKTYIDGIVVLLRIGYVASARALYEEVRSIPRYNTGNLVMALLLLEYHAGNRSEVLSMLPRTLSEFPKYAPLWFFAYSFYEEQHFNSWDGSSIRGLFKTDDITQLSVRASRVLTDDILWKLTSAQIQYYFRCILQLQVASAQEGVSLNQFSQGYASLHHLITSAMRSVLAICPASLLWKLFLLFARYAAAVGLCDIALHVGVV